MPADDQQVGLDLWPREHDLPPRSWRATPSGPEHPGGRLSLGPDQKSSTVSSRGINHRVSGSPPTKYAPITLGHGHGRNG